MNARHDDVLIEKLKSLPPEQRAEVEDFVDFLKARRERTRDEAARRLGEAFAKLDALNAPPMSRMRCKPRSTPHAPRGAAAMRIVAETNTVLSGLLWQGPPRRLLELARERKITLCTSQALLAELAEVIARDKFIERVRAARLSAVELVQDYEHLAETVTPQPLPAPVSRDPDDDHVLACAFAADAKLIVSGDKRHLLVLTEYQGIQIRTVSDALATLSASAPPRK